MSRDELCDQRRTNTGTSAPGPRKSTKSVEPHCRLELSTAVTDNKGVAGLGLAVISATS